MRRIMIRSWIAVTFGLTLAGCQMPDLQPFADATSALRSSVVASGDATIRLMAQQQGAAGDKTQPSAELQKIWVERVQAMDALVGYSDALANIAAAGNQSATNVKALGDSVSQLAEAVPGVGSSVKEPVAIAAQLATLAIQVKAAADLSDATAKAQPALKKIAEILDADLGDLALLYTTASQNAELAVNDEFKIRNDYRTKLLTQREQVRTDMFAAKASDLDAAIGRSRAVDGLLADSDKEYDAYVARHTQILSARAATLDGISKCRAGVKVWLKAHQDLQSAIKQNRRPNVRVLLTAAMEIKDSVDRIKKQQK